MENTSFIARVALDLKINTTAESKVHDLRDALMTGDIVVYYPTEFT